MPLLRLLVVPQPKELIVAMALLEYKLMLCCCLLQEVRRVWLGYMSQCDSTLGQKLAAKVQASGQM